MTTDMDLRERWLDYLSCCNDRRLEKFKDHMHDQLLFNDEPVARSDYTAAIAGNLAAVPDLRWTVENLVVQGETVAVRLTDTGTPTAQWLGTLATGAGFRITELALYHYRDGRSAAMHFLLDVPTAQQQLGRGQ